MFIRWQEYRSKAGWHRGEPPIKRCRAVLVESVRIDGKPRHRHIAFISSFDPACPDWLQPTQRRRFWYQARERLDRLDNRITPEDRAKIEAALGRRVPPTTPDEQANHESALAKLLRMEPN